MIGRARSTPVTLALALALGSALFAGACKSPPPATPLAPAAGPAEPPDDCKLDGVEEPLVAEDDPSIGRADAPLLVVEFTDLECPFCALHTATLRKMLDVYGKRMRLVVKHHPLSFHKHARVAAEASMMVLRRAGPTAFFIFQDSVFQEQGQLSEPMLVEWAKRAGVSDTASFRADLDARSDTGRVRQHLALAKRLPLGGTPSTIVNGTVIVGAKPYEEFRAAADASLAKGLGTGCEATRKTLRVEPPPPAAERWSVPVTGAPAQGPATAPVTISVFTEHECKHCPELHATLQRVRRRYGDKVRTVTHLTSPEHHGWGRKAAVLARLARAKGGDARFEEAMTLLFQRSPEIDDLGLLAVAKQVSVDPGEVNVAFDQRRFAQEEERDLDLADDADVGSLPQAFVNGIRMAGAKRIDDYIDVVDEELRTKTDHALIVETGKKTMPPKKKADAPKARDGAPTWGPADAKVTVELFSDFQCPYCRKVERTLERIREHFGKDVRVVWHDRPLASHGDAQLAAEAAREALAQGGMAAFTKLHAILFAHQGEKEGLRRERLDEYAKEAGLDVAKFKKALDERRHKAAVEAESAAAEAVGINSTPTMVVNGYLLTGSESFRHIRRVVELARGEAQPVAK